MLFTTDKQTLEDLNIFGKHGSDSVYSIFNRCTTRGGAVILEEMFRYPLSDEQAINRRSGIIKHFFLSEIVFPFSNASFDAIEPYLANRDERTKLTPENNSLGKKVGNLIAPDAATTQIIRGVTALVEVLKTVDEFIRNSDIPAGHYYENEKDIITEILSVPSLKTISLNNAKLQFATIAEYDIIMRFRNRDDIQKLLRHIYFLDVYVSVAKVAKERGFAFANALEANRHTVSAVSVYHPQVNKAVPNSININPDGNVLFLTGANMAGKSTFMKSLSIAMFLAHMGFPVPAKTFEFSVLDGIYTTINLPDNLGMGASHFYAEVLRVKKMAHELAQGKNLFIVFDELFRGTNVKDAYEATIVITKGFARRKNSLFIISTHIIEAGEILKAECSNIRFIYLPTRMNGNRPVYTYTLEPGITDDRHGMVIINNEHILDILESGIKQMTLA